MEIARKPLAIEEFFFNNAANAPSPLQVLMESRVVLELGQFFQSITHLSSLPKGDGHSVIVIPGFLTNDRYTAPLRWLLKNQGYDVHPWELGTNRAFKLRHIQNLQKKIQKLKIESGKQVSLVGWSLGGIYARYVSHSMPDHVRQVITLGTPFSRNIESNMVTRIFELLNGQKVRDQHPDIIRKIANPLPVPSTSIYSKMDGVIPWQCSVCPSPGPKHEHVEIEGSHCGLTHNPAALYTIAERLATPSHKWQPFDQSKLQQYLKSVKNPMSMVSNLKQPDSPGIKGTIQSLHALYTELKQPVHSAVKQPSITAIDKR